jgi:nucleotide-binding universal stress UspA family protein
MIKTILASLTGFSSDRTVLDAAIALARIDAGHVTFLHTRIDAVEGAALVGAINPQLHTNLPQMLQRIAQEENERSQHCKEAFSDACNRFSVTISDDPAKAEGISASLTEMTTLLNETLREARFHDLVVLARTPELSSERIQTLVAQVGRPLVIAPSKPVQVIGETVLVAWKDGPEAARALGAALPLLLRAKRVVILSVSENPAGDDTDLLSAEGVAKALKWHGIAAEVQMSYAPSVSASEKILEVAYGLDADLLVMGAYGHSRMREFVFGGVTRDILADCAIPVFMFR